MGGVTILSRHDNNMSKLLSSVFPEYEWLPWRFQNREVKPNELKLFLESIAKELNVNEMQDWYKVKEEVKIKRERKGC